MGVDLGRGNVGMAEHKLHGAKIGTMGQEMGGKGMTDHVGRDILGDACRKRYSPDDLPEPQSGHGTASCGDEEKVATFAVEYGGASLFDVGLDFFLGLDAEGYETFFATFAENPDETGGKVACGKRQVDQF